MEERNFPPGQADHPLKIDIVVPVFNAMPFLPLSLDSCLKQQNVQVRVKVFDNCSSDGSWEWLQDLARREPRLEIRRQPRNVGMLGNIQACFDWVDADAFCFLCADDMLVSSEALASAERVLRSHSEIGIVFSDMHYLDARGRILGCTKRKRAGAFCGRSVGLSSLLAGGNLFGIPLLCRGELARCAEVDPKFPYLPDLDFALRMTAKTRFWHIPEYLIANRYHAGNGTLELQRDAALQFDELAKKHSYALNSWQRFLARWSARGRMVLRHLFLRYAKSKDHRRRKFEAIS
jgi:glycosyltransferase involved in cell wall biosynthesis